MRSYSPDLLYNTIRQFVENKDALITEAEHQVVQTRFGNTEMVGFNPLFLDVSLRTDSGWHPASRQWLAGDHHKDAWEHGFDTENKVRLIRNSYLTKLFVYRESEIDVVLFPNKNANITFSRYILEDGQVSECWSCFTSPKQYQVELFKYSHGKAIASEVRTWYDSPEGWKESRLVAKHTFDHDSHGLLRAYQDSGFSSSGAMKLVFVRPGMGRIQQQRRARRVFVGYSIALGPDEPDKAHRVYSDAYGIEMSISIESQCPVDIVLTAPPRLVHVITKSTDVTSTENISAGASFVSGICDIRKTRRSGGKWVLVDASNPTVEQQIRRILRTKLAIIVCVHNFSEATKTVQLFDELNSDRLVVALKFAEIATPTSAQTAAVKIREIMKQRGCNKSRIVVASKIEPSEAVEFVVEHDIDGVFLCDASFADLLDALVPIVLESKSQDEKAIDRL